LKEGGSKQKLTHLLSTKGRRGGQETKKKRQNGPDKETIKPKLGRKLMGTGGLGRGMKLR